MPHRRDMARSHERMSDKFHRQRRIRVTADLEREDDRHRIEVACHRETPFRLPCPDLGADVVQRPDRAAALHRQAALAQGRGQPQIEPGVIHEAHRLRPVLADPAQRLVEQLAEKRIILQHLHEPDHGRRRHVMQQLDPGRRQPGAAERGDHEPGLFRAQLAHHPGPVLVPRVLARDDEQVDATLSRWRQLERHTHRNSGRDGPLGRPERLGGPSGPALPPDL